MEFRCQLMSDPVPDNQPATGKPTDKPPVEPRAVIRRSRRWSAVWVVPLVALGLAAWLLWKHYAGQGPLVYVRFETADSIESGKTEVRCRSVRLGVVETVSLSPDLLTVVVGLRIDPGSEHLLREGTRFWVVRPRVSGSTVSGLNTLISGSYVEMDPGDGREDIHHFNGLEVPPVTKSSVPGLRLTLTADNAGSLAIGSPIYFKGFEVGRVDSREFDLKDKLTRFQIFIQQQYQELVTENTTFWNHSGIDIGAGADGFRIRTPSLTAMLAGGASFAVPPDKVAGPPARNDAVYKLYPDEASTHDASFRPDARYLLMFQQSIRGLKKDAPVEYRGIPIGSVVDVALTYAPPGDDRVPVMIEVDANAFRNGPDDDRTKEVIMRDAVARGLRASLGSGSLLTGALFIDLDYAKDVPPAEITQIGEHDVLPTRSAGLAQLEAKVNAILAKIENMPIEETLQKFGATADAMTKTITEAQGVVAEAQQILDSPETQAMTAEINETLRAMRTSVASFGPTGSMQGDLRRTLDELRAAIRSFKVLSDNVADKPNSLIFGKESKGNPIPKARKN